MIEKEKITPAYIIKESKEKIFVCEYCGKSFRALAICKDHEKECFALKEFMKTKSKFEKGDIVKFINNNLLTFAKIIEVYPCQNYKLNSFQWFIKVDEYELDDGCEIAITKIESDFDLVMTRSEYEAKIKEIVNCFKYENFFGAVFQGCGLDHETGNIKIILEKFVRMEKTFASLK